MVDKLNNLIINFNLGLFIDGEFTEGVKKGKIKVIDPSNEEVICEVSEGTEEDVELAVQAAKKAFVIWNEMTSDVKAKLFIKLAEKLEQQLEDFAYLEALDNGKPLKDAREDIIEVVRLIRYYAGLLENVYGKTFPQVGEISIQTRRVPYGVVGCIVPWNYPLLMTSWKIFPALAAGNSVILKQSEETPLTGLKIAGLFKELGFPNGVLNIITGYGHIAGAYLSQHLDVDKLAFTGSTEVGRKIMKASADSNLKGVHLELGGKSPMVVFEDADIENALEWVIDGAFRNSSQNCACGSRLYIQSAIYDEFITKLCDKAKSIKVGRFDEDGVWMGPLINARQYQNCKKYLQIAKNENLEVALLGRYDYLAKGFFVEPSIFKNVPETSQLVREEIFGPILSILKPFQTVQEVLEKVNNSLYGLASAVFTTDMNKTEYFIRNTKAGTVWVNCYNINPYNVPFGGMKHSGFGRDNGDEVMSEYTCVKSVYQKYDMKFKF